MHYDLAISPFGASASEIVDVARCAETSGFDGLWTYDHITGVPLNRGRSHDVFALLGAMATATDRVRVGPLVANMMNRHPAQLAVAMATIQSLSSGRAVLGLGAGPTPGSRFADEHSAIATQLIDGPSRRRRLVETIDVVRGLWAGPLTHQGEFFSITDLDIGLDAGSCPSIIIGASGARTVELAMAHADGVNITATDRLPSLLESIDRSALRPDFELSVHVPFDAEHFDDEDLDGFAVAGVDRVVLAVAAPFDLSTIENFRS